MNRLVPAEPTEGRMRIVPEVATEEMVRASADKMIFPTVHMGGPSVMARRQAGGILQAGLDAAPSAGRVSREAVERVARGMCERAFRHRRRWDPCPPPDAEVAINVENGWLDHVAEAAAVCHDLGLTVAPDADTAREREGGAA